MTFLRGTRLLVLSASLLVIVAAAILAESGPGPSPAVSQPSCAACGMTVDQVEWLARIVYTDGTTDSFDGPKCLFKTLAGIAKKKKIRRDDVAEVYVTTYYDRQLIRAEGATFVYGSDVRGPMGNELVPHATLEEAKEFLRDHGGKGIVQFSQVTPELLRSL